MHTDPELLGLLALGEDAGSSSERAHLQECASCAREMSELHRLAALGRSVGPETTLATPSEAVWHRIQRELGLDPSVLPPTRGSLFLPSDDLVPPLEDQSSRPATPPRRTATLRPTGPGWADAGGHAVLEVDEQGRQVLTLELTDPAGQPAHRLAWLVQSGAPDRRLSLGMMDGPHGVWSVGRQVDLERYRLLEITLSADETNAAGEPVARGELLPA